MKKILPILVLQLAFLLSQAVVRDNQSFFDNNPGNVYLIVPMADNGQLMVSRTSFMQQTLVRFNAQGQTMWSKVMDGVISYTLNDAAMCTDNGAFLMYSGSLAVGISNQMVVKLDSSGNVSWTRSFDVSAPQGRYHNVIAKPQADGGLLFAVSLYDKMGAVRLNANGSVATSIILTPDVTGNAKCPAFDAEPAANGGMIVTGKNESDPVIVCVNANGSVAWNLNYANNGYNQLRSLIKTADGNYLVSGMYMSLSLPFLDSLPSFNFTSVGFATKFTPAGNVLWQKTYVPAGSDSNLIFSLFSQAIENPDGTITLSGTVSEDMSSLQYNTITNLAATGQVISAYILPNTQYDGFGYNATRLYKNAAGEVRISDLEQDSIDSYWHSVLLVPADLSDYCRARSLQYSLDTMPAISTLPTGTFTQQAMPAPTQPDVTTQDVVVSFTFQNVCGLVAGVSGISEVNEAMDLSVQPNPVSSSGKVTLKWSGEEPVKNILVHDVNGRLLRQIEAGSAPEITFNTNGLSAGLYLLDVLNGRGEKLAVKKLIVTE